jgi:NDP-sugar pyrophosphorylase family protein
MGIQAIILAGGEGRRLRPLTTAIPKPLLPVGNKPIMERIIEQLRSSGVKEIGVATGYKTELIEAYFRDGARLGVHLHYVREPTKLGTAGPLAAFADWVQGPVLVVNGDILTGQDFGQLHAFHVATGTEMTVGVRAWQLSVPFGVIEAAQGLVTGVREKPGLAFLINTGLYVIDPSVVSCIPPGRYLDVPDLIRDMIAAGRPVATFSIEAPWVDVGSLEDLAAASTLIAQQGQGGRDGGGSAEGQGD